MARSTSPHTQQRFREVPFYLQEVLTDASNFTRTPDNYNALVNAALELDEALFLTLNYDTLLDTRFAEYSPLTNLDWYIEADGRWSLIKLHGSVNWAWRLPLLDAHSSLGPGGHDNALRVIHDYAVAGFPQLSNDDIHVFEDGVRGPRWDDSEHAAVWASPHGFTTLVSSGDLDRWMRDA
jgi:hypothetical protein